MKSENNKSDILAKKAYKEKLEKDGFVADITQTPADITAEKDGQIWYFEIKKTSHTDKYFGAATMTEWERALEDQDHFRFVIAIELGEDKWKFREYTPSEFMERSTIPPFKVYFNLDLLTDEKSKKRKSKAVRMTSDNFNKFKTAYEQLNRG